MLRTRWALSVLLLLPTVGCQGKLSGTNRALCTDKPGSARGYIVGGRISDDVPAIGFLTDASGEAFCTATLIADRRIVTAAHCNIGATAFGIGGSDTAARTVRIISSTSHPSYDDTTLVADIAIMELAESAGVTPLPVASSPPRVGERIMLVGYGVDDGRRQTGGGTRRQTDVDVNAVTAQAWQYQTGGTSACYGDSGGPAVRRTATGLEVVGIASSVFDDYCSTGGEHIRIDVYRDFLGDLTTPAPTPAPQPTPTPSDDTLCTETCMYAADGECDDGGPGSLYSVCELGTDCTDCGARAGDVAPPSETPDDVTPPERTPPPGTSSGPACNDTCTTASDGQCDDGGSGSQYCVCELGTDCADCGPR